MSKKAWALTIVGISVLLLGVIWANQRQYQATEVEKCIRNLQNYEFPHTRAYAAKVLGQMGPAARPAVPALLEALRDEDGQVSRAAAEALGKIRPGPDAIPGLMACLKNPRPFTRMQAAESLGCIGPPAQEAVPALKEALEDKDVLMRLTTAEALYKITGSAQPYLPIVIPVLESQKGFIRARAAQVLTAMGPDAKDALPELRAALDKDLPSGVREDIQEAIEKIGGKEQP